MKTLISIFSILILSFSVITTPPETNENTQQLTFDGYEGEYYFFTDQAHQAVVLESNSELTRNLKSNDVVGEQFAVAYTPKAQTTTSSSQGIIESIEKK